MSRVPSYKKIDYSLRPAKAIERKMMVDMLRRLDRSTSLSHYRYVGFGSPYFADFNLFHRSLGIRDLISIEREVADEARFRFNAPYAAVDLKFGESTEVLPELEWSQRSIVWLDYDGRLGETELNDIAFLTQKLAGGSVLAVSVNVSPHQDLDTRLAKTRAELGDYLPRSYTAEDLSDWGTAQACRDIINERIQVALRERNTGQSDYAAISYRQLFNFHYRDGARMLTVGGVLFDAGQEASLRSCAFDDFEFCKDTGEAFEIAVPRLTLKEMRYLDAQLPGESYSDLESVGIPDEDAREYASLYRYFPKFVDTEP